MDQKGAKIRVESSVPQTFRAITICSMAPSIFELITIPYNSRNDEKLTNFVIKEQGKCFELARTGRELILLLREDENNEGVEDLLNVRPILG